MTFFFFSVKGVNPRIQVLCDSKLSQDLSETVQSHEAWVQPNHHSQFQLGRRNIDPESIVLSQKTGCSLSSARKGNFIVLLLEMTEAYINTASESPALPSARNRNRLPQHLGRSGSMYPKFRTGKYQTQCCSVLEGRALLTLVPRQGTAGRNDSTSLLSRMISFQEGKMTS